MPNFESLQMSWVLKSALQAFTPGLVHGSPLTARLVSQRAFRKLTWQPAVPRHCPKTSNFPFLQTSACFLSCEHDSADSSMQFSPTAETDSSHETRVLNFVQPRSPRQDTFL